MGISSLYEFFWDEETWLPMGITWDSMHSNATFTYPESKDMAYPIAIGISFLILRLVLECFVFLPFAYYSGRFTHFLPEGETLPRILWNHMTGGFSQQTKIKKCLETAWRWWFYQWIFVYGCYVMWNKEWLWNVAKAWEKYPRHHLPNEIWWYYIIETSFYYSLLISGVTDTRRKDYKMLMFHHCVTIGLLYISWTINFVRVGTLVLFSHDLADVILEGGKLVRYSDLPPVFVNVIFVIFMGTWLVTRLGYYPFILLNSAVFEAPGIIQTSYRWENLLQPPHVPRVIVGMLIMLLMLHIVWTYIILKIAIVTVQKGEADDVRSESEEDEVEVKKTN